jgi:hypothetical protein
MAEDSALREAPRRYKLLTRGNTGAESTSVFQVVIMATPAAAEKKSLSERFLGRSPREEAFDLQKHVCHA